MAKQAVDRIVEREGREAPCRTHEIPLGMGTMVAESCRTVAGVDEETWARCSARYGTREPGAALARRAGAAQSGSRSAR